MLKKNHPAIILSQALPSFGRNPDIHTTQSFQLDKYFRIFFNRYVFLTFKASYKKKALYHFDSIFLIPMSVFPTHRLFENKVCIGDPFQKLGLNFHSAC